MLYALLGFLCLNCLAAANTADDSLLFLVPHVVDGGSWKTTLKFVNLGTHDVQLFVFFQKDGGGDLPVPISIDGGPSATRVFAFLSITPGQSTTIATTSIAILNQSDRAVPLIARIRDRTGKVIDQQTLLLPKITHVAFGLRCNASAFTTFNAFTVIP